MTIDPRAASHAGALPALLGDAIDYAGLFPPAQLDMAGAVAEYASYLTSPDRWALGRFVVPAARLPELAAEGESLAAGSRASFGGSGTGWALSVLLGTEVTGDVERVRAFAASQAARPAKWTARVDALEARASSPDAIDAIAKAVGDSFTTFVEIPIGTDPEQLVRAIAAAGLRAKVRTGGTTTEAFPTTDQLVRFLASCVAAGVSFKATAGLHHPLRGEYRLTYAEGSPRGTMFGFLNVFLASAMLAAGESRETATQLLDEREPGAVRFDEGGVTWRGHRLTREQLAHARATAITSFGSCSFREPIDDLDSLGMV